MVILDNEYFRLESLTRNAYRVVRSKKPFESAAAAASACAPLLLELDARGRVGSSLLIDTRSAVPNNEPEYEAWYAPCRKGIVRDFDRVALLVQTKVGELHASRLSKNDGVRGAVGTFLDEGEALHFLGVKLERA